MCEDSDVPFTHCFTWVVYRSQLTSPDLKRAAATSTPGLDVPGSPACAARAVALAWWRLLPVRAGQRFGAEGLTKAQLPEGIDDHSWSSPGPSALQQVLTAGRRSNCSHDSAQQER